MLFLVVMPLPRAAWGGVYDQQGTKLVGAGPTGSPNQGSGVAVSADGSTLIVGGPRDATSSRGAVWFFTRSGGVWSPQGNKLVGPGGTTFDTFGSSTALSADGNTALIGDPDNNSGFGAAWVFVRNGGTWTSQAKLVANSAGLGASVALSADGNTALLGGNGDNNNLGAAWVFTRSNGTWTQQGKLVPGDATGSAYVGSSVSLSADGNTAVIGGPFQQGAGGATNAGATWVFTRTAGAWAQYGNRLFGSGGTASPQQGKSVAISGDGQTILIGGPADGSAGPDAGAAWVFVLSNAVWTQQEMLIGPGTVPGNQGTAVSLSGDGNTALIGGPDDGSNTGATWIWLRSNGAWTVPGGKMVGTGPSGASGQGIAVSLSADASTAAVGGPNDANLMGATWIFARTTAHDFNFDSRSDIAWRDTSGNTAVWLMSGATATSSAQLGNVPTTWSIVGQRDFNKDGNTDLLWRDTSGNTSVWFMIGTTVVSLLSVGNIPITWSVIGTGDFNGDGFGDIIWRDNSGNASIWLMKGVTVSSSAGLGTVPLTWNIVGTGDYNGDGMSDLLWRDNLGNTSIWFMNGTAVASTGAIGNIPSNWSVVGTGDFNGDGMSDIVWRDTSGNTSIWLMNGATVATPGALGNVPTTWSIAQVGDYNGDGKSDLLWRDTTGNTSMWFMNGVTVSATAAVGNIPTSWTVQSTNAE
jgi:hypothetical protein